MEHMFPNLAAVKRSSQKNISYTLQNAGIYAHGIVWLELYDECSIVHARR